MQGRELELQAWGRIFQEERKAGGKTWRKEKAGGFVEGRRARTGEYVEEWLEGWVTWTVQGLLQVFRSAFTWRTVGSHWKILGRGMVP